MIIRHNMIIKVENMTYQRFVPLLIGLPLGQ